MAPAVENVSRGALIAPFTGVHGWYWKNNTDAPVTVVLTSSGCYSDIFKKRARGVALQPTAIAAGPATPPESKEKPMKKLAAVLGVTLTLASVNAAVAHPAEDHMRVVNASEVKLDVTKTANGATVLVRAISNTAAARGVTPNRRRSIGDCESVSCDHAIFACDNVLACADMSDLLFCGC